MRNIPTERILGFDAREMWQDFIKGDWPWPVSRKQSMLIRQDILKPLTTSGWATVFDIQGFVEEDGPFRMYQDGRLHRPNWTGVFDLWENLQDLEDHLNAGWDDTWEPCWVIAVTLIQHRFSTEEEVYWNRQLGSTIPNIVEKNWRFLGYDVSDSSLLSGLTGFGHPDSDQQYVPYLNQYHLFTDLDQALKFRTEMNEGNPQHAPFFVYGLYLIKDAATGKTWTGRGSLTLVIEDL